MENGHFIPVKRKLFDPVLTGQEHIQMDIVLKQILEQLKLNLGY